MKLVVRHPMRAKTYELIVFLTFTCFKTEEKDHLDRIWGDILSAPAANGFIDRNYR
jgi:hypothetical protein